MYRNRLLFGMWIRVIIPLLLWNPKVHYRLQKSPPLVPILSYMDPVPTIISYLRSIIILSPPPPSTKSFLSLRFSEQHLIHISYVFHACHMARPSHPPWFDYPNDTCWRVYIIKFSLRMQFFSNYLLLRCLVRSKNSSKSEALYNIS
jgi:hypothetical protein